MTLTFFEFATGANARPESVGDKPMSGLSISAKPAINFLISNALGSLELLPIVPSAFAGLCAITLTVISGLGAGSDCLPRSAKAKRPSKEASKPCPNILTVHLLKTLRSACTAPLKLDHQKAFLSSYLLLVQSLMR